MGITNLDEQFTFYASYHHDRLNKLIHIICVWPIVWSALVLAQYASFEISPQFLPSVSALHPINVSMLVAMLYATAYILMDKRAGSLATILLVICLFTGRKFFLESVPLTGFPAWQVAVSIQVIAWALQFVGHGAFEGRAPALFDNLFQAVLMAPMFVLLEVMFAFGYRKEFQVKMWKNVEREIAKLNAKDHKTKSKKR